MTHARLLRGAHLSERSSKLVAFEKRIVAKPAVAARRGNDAARDDAATNDFPSAVDIGCRAHVSRSTVRRIGEGPNQQRVVLAIKRIAGEIRASAPTLA